jgi:hypothetical protein
VQVHSSGSVFRVVLYVFTVVCLTQVNMKVISLIVRSLVPGLNLHLGQCGVKFLRYFTVILFYVMIVDYCNAQGIVNTHSHMHTSAIGNDQ